MHKGFYSFDAMLSSLVVVFMLFHSLSLLSIASYDNYIFSYNEKMNKFWIASEYAVNYNSKKTYKLNPNLFDEPSLLELKRNSEKIANSLGLKRISFSFEDCSEERVNVIVRYVVFEEENRIKKLYVCGD